MAVSARKVQNKRDGNGVLTGKPGTVYDVNIKYNSPEGKKTYSKKGFATKKEATQHEAEMKAKLANPVYTPVIASQGKQTVKEYLSEWVENHGKANLRPSTFASYKGHIKNHIVPYIGHVQLNQLTPAMLDNMFQQLFDKGLSNSTVRYAQRILSVSMEHARKYHYIEHNPARDIITKFGKQGKTPDPYTIEQMQKFMSNVIGTEWEMPVVLAGMYGLRMSEIIGLRTKNIDLENTLFEKCEVAGPGFINFFFSPMYYAEVLKDVEEEKENYGSSDYGKGQKIMVEFVSANPTGPMHMGNARGGALGDCLAAVLNKAGYNAWREFYVNDAGNQIEKFACSLEARYLQIYKEGIEFPEDGYQGGDITDLAQEYADENGDLLVNADSNSRKKALVDYALPKNISKMQSDIARRSCQFTTPVIYPLLKLPKRAKQKKWNGDI